MLLSISVNVSANTTDDEMYTLAKQGYLSADSASQELYQRQLERLAYSGVDPAARFLANAPELSDQRVHWLYLSTLMGNPLSYFNLAQHYLAQSNRLLASVWLKRALVKQTVLARSSSQEAYQMATMLEWAIVRFGAQLDPSSAMNWYAKAAQGGHPGAMFALGRASLTGKGLPQNVEVAHALLTIAADADSNQAQQLLDWLDLQS